jgi:hypothetical protein
MAAASEWLGKNVPTATDMRATIEVLLEMEFSVVADAEGL